MTKQRKLIALGKHEIEALECLLDGMAFYYNEKDSTEYRRILNEYESILFALDKLNYNIEDYKIKKVK